MAKINFKAGRRSSRSCDDYREIIKSGDIKNDMAYDADDVIHIWPADGTRVIIDCDKKTGEFRLKFTPNPKYEIN
jgi:hypothetical protein